MNTLYPIFLKTTQLEILIVGGGHTAHEKLHFILKNSPDARITVVASEIRQELFTIAQPKAAAVQFIQKPFEPTDLDNKNIVIATTDNYQLHQEIYTLCKAKNILINVADTPELCDFYLGSIVTKGNLKVAISTNGKSPTLAKRLREFFEDVLPDDIEELSQHLNDYRNKIGGDLKEKIDKLNQLTQLFIDKK